MLQVCVCVCVSRNIFLTQSPNYKVNLVTVRQNFIFVRLSESDTSRFTSQHIFALHTINNHAQQCAVKVLLCPELLTGSTCSIDSSDIHVHYDCHCTQ